MDILSTPEGTYLSSLFFAKVEALLPLVIDTTKPYGDGNVVMYPCSRKLSNNDSSAYDLFEG